jgi:hypothetical protein
MKTTNDKTTKNTIQIQIIEISTGIAIYCPYHLNNNECFRKSHGKYDKIGNRWILPANSDTKAEIVKLFGSPSPNVIVRVAKNDLIVHENQLVHGGYLVANWDERNNSIKMPVGVEIATGSWDIVASAENKHPCMVGGDASLKVVVRKDYAGTHGLEVVEELGFDQLEKPLQPFSDADLQVELENRGYRVHWPETSLF